MKGGNIVDIQWFSKSLQGIVTIYETNITLNTVASSYFENAFSTLIGFDKTSNTLIIKSISKNEVDEGSFKEQDLHPISIKPSYGRINGKMIITNLCRVFPLDFSNKKMHKYYCDWDDTKKYLKVYLSEEVK